MVSTIAKGFSSKAAGWQPALPGDLKFLTETQSHIDVIKWDVQHTSRKRLGPSEIVFF
jgi:hypothetical protein